MWETDIKDLYDNRGIEPTLPDDLSKLLTLATDGYKASKCKKDKKDKKEKDKKDNTKDKSEDDVLVQQVRFRLYTMLIMQTFMSCDSGVHFIVAQTQSIILCKFALCAAYCHIVLTSQVNTTVIIVLP